MFKKDNFFAGMTMAFLATIITAVLLILIIPLIYSQSGAADPKLLLLSMVPSLLLVRYYLKNLGFGKSGQGALLVVFLIMILWFTFLTKVLSSFPSF